MATTRRGSSSSSSSSNWLYHHYQPPLPAPKILHLPRRPRSSRPPSTAATKNVTVVKQQAHPHKSPPPRPPREQGAEPCGRLEALFERERPFTSERRARVAEASSPSTSTASPGSSPSPSQSPASRTCRRSPEAPARSGESEVEKWRFEAEVLRAECNFLRMEREVTGKKIQRSRERVDAVLRSAIEAVVSGRRKVDGNQRVETALEELQGKLECLRKSMRISRHKGGGGSSSRDNINPQQHVGWGSYTRNFDKKALVLRRRLQEMNVREMMPKSRIRDGCGGGGEEEEEEEEVCVREIREIASEATTGGRSSRDEKPSTGGGAPEDDDDVCESITPDVDALSRKMQIISMGMLERVEEYGSILSSSSCASASGAATVVVSSSEKQVRSDNLKAGVRERTMQLVVHQKQQLQQDEGGGDVEGRGEAPRCSGVCKDVVARIVEQVRAETDQWAEMQAMIGQVREEMDELRRTRDFWERRAAQSDHKIRSITAQVAELRQRAGAAERRATELEEAAARYGDLLRAWGTAASAKQPLGEDGGADRAGRRPGVDIKPSSPCQMHKRIEKTGLFSRFVDENAVPAHRAAAHAHSRPPLREIQISSQS